MWFVPIGCGMVFGVIICWSIANTPAFASQRTPLSFNRLAGNCGLG